MNYKQELINHLVNISKLNSPNVVLESVSITVPKYITDVAINLINNSHQWYLYNLATSTKTYNLPGYQLPTEFATLVLGNNSHLLFPCQIEELFPYKDEIKMSPSMWTNYGKFIDISVVLFPSNEDWKNIYAVNREAITAQYLRYEEEQEKLRIELDKQQTVIDKYDIK